MGEAEVNAFLTNLAMRDKVSASTQNQALSGLLFLYRYVLERPLGDLGQVIRARKPRRLPVVLTRQEVKALLVQLTDQKWLMGALMYGAGLRLTECLCLRVQDLDFGAGQILVRDGKGFKDRITVLPQAVCQLLRTHLERVRQIHQKHLMEGYGRVSLPNALERKYPHASRHWGWQWVFPQEHRWINPKTGEQGRHHVDESIIQKAVKVAAARAGINRHATCHPYGTRLRPTCWNLDMTSEPYRNSSATRMWRPHLMYTHVLNRGGKGVRSPVDMP